MHGVSLCSAAEIAAPHTEIDRTPETAYSLKPLYKSQGIKQLMADGSDALRELHHTKTPVPFRGGHLDVFKVLPAATCQRNR